MFYSDYPIIGEERNLPLYLSMVTIVRLDIYMFLNAL